MTVSGFYKEARGNNHDCYESMRIYKNGRKKLLNVHSAVITIVHLDFLVSLR